jgi:hypothetical protein
MNKYKILGEGWFGIIIQLPIKCNTEIDVDINSV